MTKRMTRDISRRLLALAMAGLVSLTPALPAAATSRPVEIFEPQDYVVGAWWLYKSVFVEEGRVIDRTNGGVSHSESQGYGMLLAVAANDRAAFEAIWTWTQAHLYVRGDNLASWKWDPAATPHVADPNNATDGDLLIAWALVRAHRQWTEPAFLEAARAIATDIQKTVIERHEHHGTILLPAEKGFSAGEQPDGPVVNLSYWVFPAIAELGQAFDDFPARELLASGLRLLEIARFGPEQLPADWISLKGATPVPAAGFAANFGYEAIRIPLYAAWHDALAAGRLSRLQDHWRRSGTGNLYVIELTTASPLTAMSDPGYSAVRELLRCSLGQPADPERLLGFQPTEYYPSTLNIMSMIATSETYPRCL